MRAIGATPPGDRRGRKVLLVSPRFAASFGTMQRAFGLAGVKASMPPQGLLAIAGHLPEHWEKGWFRMVAAGVRHRRHRQ